MKFYLIALASLLGSNLLAADHGVQEKIVSASGQSFLSTTFAIPSEWAKQNSPGRLSYVDCRLTGTDKVLWTLRGIGGVEFDINTGKETRRFKGTKVSENGAVSMDWKDEYGTEVALFETLSGKQLATKGEKPFKGAFFPQFSGDGKSIVSVWLEGGKNKLRIFNPDGTQRKEILLDPKFSAFTDTVGVSHDGSTIVLPERDPPRILVIDAKSGAVKNLDSFKAWNDNFQRSVVLSPDGKYLVLATDRLLIFDLKTNKLVFEHMPKKKGIKAEVSNIQISPTGTRLAWNSDAGVEMISFPPKPKEQPELFDRLVGQCLGFSPDGKQLVAWDTAKDSFNGDYTRVDRVKVLTLDKAK